MEQQQQNGVQSVVFFLLWKENEWWRHMLRLFIHIYGVFHSFQLYTRLRTKYFTMDRNWMNIVKKKQQRNNFLLLLFSELICDEKGNMTSFSCQSSIYSFLTHPNITLFSAFFAFFLFPFIDRFNNVRYVRAMLIHLYSIEWYTGHFFFV